MGYEELEEQQDSRERIEADLLTLTKNWHDYDGDFMKLYSSVAYAQVKELLDRQARLTERECLELGAAVQNQRDKKIAELQAELDAYNQTHMELPVDADGVPIREGDVVQFVNDAGGTGAAVEVCAISEHYVYYGEGKHFYRAANCRHVKPRRSLEDVLATFRFDAKNIYDDPMLNGNERVDELDALDADVAAEIRELMGADE